MKKTKKADDVLFNTYCSILKDVGINMTMDDHLGAFETIVHSHVALAVSAIEDPDFIQSLIFDDDGEISKDFRIMLFEKLTKVASSVLEHKKKVTSK